MEKKQSSTYPLVVHLTSRAVLFVRVIRTPLGLSVAGLRQVALPARRAHRSAWVRHLAQLAGREVTAGAGGTRGIRGEVA